MTVYELNAEQFSQLKQNYLCEKYFAEDKFPSWGELANADELITDEEIYEAYEGVCFVEDDFC